MKYFTPVRYVAFNSRDDAVANNASDEWEQALADYSKHLKSIFPRLSSKVKIFAKKCFLHDTDFVDWQKTKFSDLSSDVAMLTVRESHKQYSLFYTLKAEPSVTKPIKDPIFEVARPQWLYDEFDVTKDGMMQHEILFSDGQILMFQFSDFNYLTVYESEKPKIADERPVKKRSATG